MFALIFNIFLITKLLNIKLFIEYISFPKNSSYVQFHFLVSVTHNQPEHIKWKIPEMNNSWVLNKISHNTLLFY